MAVKTNAELAAFFQTGDQPSETEFGHLIDTIQPAHVLLTDADTSITTADHAFRTLIIPNISDNRTYTLPTPAVDTWFHFVYLPLVADSHTLTVATLTNGSHFYEGGIVHTDTNLGVGSVPDSDMVFGNGTNHDKFKILSAKGADFWIWGKSSTVWYIWGTSIGDTPSTIDNS